jgi:hypothetical protein
MLINSAKRQLKMMGHHFFIVAFLLPNDRASPAGVAGGER